MHALFDTDGIFAERIIFETVLKAEALKFSQYLTVSRNITESAKVYRPLFHWLSFLKEEN